MDGLAGTHCKNDLAALLTEDKLARSNSRKCASLPVCCLRSFIASSAFLRFRPAMYTLAFLGSRACGSTVENAKHTSQLGQISQCEDEVCDRVLIIGPSMEKVTDLHGFFTNTSIPTRDDHDLPCEVRDVTYGERRLRWKELAKGGHDF